MTDILFKENNTPTTPRMNMRMWLVGLMVLISGLTVYDVQGFAAEESELVSTQNDPDPPVEEGTPIFSIKPQHHYYIVKNRPVTITCKASPAVQINFKCSGQWVKPKHHVNVELVDPATGIKYLQTSIDVTSEEVEEYFGLDGYWCECHAWNSLPDLNQPRSAKSNRALVQNAFLKKRFEREPINLAVELESQVQLQCLPPKGLPSPEVFWQKDGEELDIDKEMNFIISSEGNLIISQVRLEDRGNYTCGASNVASRRLSESATLTVYVNGGWSSWGHWSECNNKCGKGFQKRSRACDNPIPGHGGNLCQGEEMQRVPCTSVCPVAGWWSTWSSWSTCSPDCKHHRRRLCDNPSPQHGGPYCEGSDLDTSNCTTGMCKEGRMLRPGEYSKSVGPVDKQNIAMYVGLIVAIAVFITVVIIIIFLLRRKSQNNAKNKKSGIIIGSDDKKLSKGTQDMISAQPDLTQTVVSVTIQNHNAMDTPNNNHLGSNDKVPVYTDNALNNQKAMLIDFPHTPTKQCNNGEGTLISLGDNKSGDYAELESRPTSMYSERTNRHSVMSCQVPNNIDSESLVWASFTYQGGRMSIPESGVSVTVPEGAVKKGQTEELFLAVCRDDKDRPKLTDSQTVLGPVILVGPPGVPLKKPVIVSFQHSASIKHGQWALSIYGSDSSYDEPPQWQSLVTLGQETINTPIYTQVDMNQCHIMTEHLIRYVMVGEPNMAGKAVKILRLAAFAPAVPSGIDYNVRVYFVEDTHDALESVMQVERKLGGRILDKPKQMWFQFGGGNLCLAMEELGPGWRCKLAANYQEIPFRHIWSGTQNTLHCSFALENVDRSSNQPLRLACSIQVFQKNLVDNIDCRQALNISCNLSERLPASPEHLVPKSVPTRSSTVTSSSGHVPPTVVVDNPHHVFRLPVHIKGKLCQILDPPNARGNDWRMLAQRLSVDRYINYFATKRSPTEHILDLWEARHREKSAITELMNSLRVMGRMDATAVIEKECGAWL